MMEKETTTTKKPDHHTSIKSVIESVLFYMYVFCYFFLSASIVMCENKFHNLSLSDIPCNTILGGKFGPALFEGPQERGIRGGAAQYEEQQQQADEDDEGDENAE
jgi:hypothetical protein